MAVSASTSTAPMNSAACPISMSRAKAARRTPTQDGAPGAVSAAEWLTRYVPRCSDHGSGQRPDILLQQRPGLVARLLLHLIVEPGLFQHFLERLRIGRVEDHALAGEVLPLVRRHLLPVLALDKRRGVEMLGRKVLQVV